MLVFLDHAQDFANDGNAALVVAAENGAAVGAQNIAVEHRHDAFAGNHGIHVSGKQQRRSAGDVAGKMSDEIAYVAADLFSGVVDRKPSRRALPSRA